jgi:hypothetical protein
MMRLHTLFGVISVLFSLSFAAFADANTHEGASEAEILAYQEPAVQHLLPNEQLLYDRIYRRISGEVAIYNAPDGELISMMDSGFHFITTHGSEGDYTMMNDGQWVQNSSLSDVSVSRFAGVLLPDDELPYPFAWVLVHTRASQAPGIEPLQTDPLLLRYQLVNIYSSVVVDGWRWYQVGIDQWIIQTQLAKYLPVTRTPDIRSERWVSVDLYEQVAIAYEGTRPVFATLISSGLAAWPTNEGVFEVYVRYPRTRMSGAEGRPDFYYLEEVPWTMYFDGDIALHGAYWHDGFGYRRSHGCVNMSITDAAWLYQWASPEFDLSIPNDKGPSVYVYSSGVYR